MKSKLIETIFHEHGGQLRMSEAIRLGISRYQLYKLRDDGVLEQLSRGLYRLASLPPISNPDLVTVSLRAKNAVICLVSALALHKLTTQIPHQVSIAIPRESRPPLIDHPPIRAYKFSKTAYEAGIESIKVDNTMIKVYSAEKTITDCFKYRNKIGIDVCIEAIQLYKERKNFNVRMLYHYAKICRVEKVMEPYLQAIT